MKNNNLIKKELDDLQFNLTSLANLIKIIHGELHEMLPDLANKIGVDGYGTTAPKDHYLQDIIIHLASLSPLQEWNDALISGVKAVSKKL